MTMGKKETALRKEVYRGIATTKTGGEGVTHHWRPRYMTL
jgi:hypothetical protein